MSKLDRISSFMYILKVRWEEQAWWVLWISHNNLSVHYYGLSNIHHWSLAKFYGLLLHSFPVFLIIHVSFIVVEILEHLLPRYIQ